MFIVQHIKKKIKISNSIIIIIFCLLRTHRNRNAVSIPGPYLWEGDVSLVAGATRFSVYQRGDNFILKKKHLF